MKAKFATVCATCQGRVAPGEEIVSAGSGARSGWVHASCKPGLFEAGTAPAAAPARTTPTARKKAVRVEAPIPTGVTAVYTDGSCSGNPGAGGWAWVIADGRQDSGGENPTTNQRMEVKAALEAIRALDDSPLVVVSDSTYVVNCFRDRWWVGWRARGWKNSQKQPVANRDLWEPLVDLVECRGDVTFRWVKGHSGDPMNDRVDELAVAATAAQLKLAR